ncbi:MAG: 2OG-Fe(II) oxygenase [Candidatus Sericytochromatia bacterium]
MNSAIQPNAFVGTPITCPELFSPAECESIRKLPFIRSSEGQVQLADQHDDVASQYRRTTCHNIAPTPENLWINERVLGLIKESNRNYYHFHINFLSELQVMEYQPEGFYDWHLDLGEGMYSTRKLSVVVFLSRPDEYSGGRLVLEPRHHQLPHEQGTALIFPSFLLHRVEPVTQGQRWTLVAWAHGPVFA